MGDTLSRASVLRLLDLKIAAANEALRMAKTDGSGPVITVAVEMVAKTAADIRNAIAAMEGRNG